MKLQSKNSKLEEQARKNTSVKRGTSKNSETLKEGVPNDHSPKHLGGRSVGMNVGSTISMGNYESLRVDVWATDVLADNETMEQGYARLKGVIDKVLADTVNSYTED